MGSEIQQGEIIADGAVATANMPCNRVIKANGATLFGQCSQRGREELADGAELEHRVWRYGRVAGA